MLLQIGPILRLGLNVITDGTFITLGYSYYTCAFYSVSLAAKGGMHLINAKTSILVFHGLINPMYTM